MQIFYLFNLRTLRPLMLLRCGLKNTETIIEIHRSTMRVRFELNLGQAHNYEIIVGILLLKQNWFTFLPTKITFRFPETTHVSILFILPTFWGSSDLRRDTTFSFADNLGSPPWIGRRLRRRTRRNRRSRRRRSSRGSSSGRRRRQDGSSRRGTSTPSSPSDPERASRAQRTCEVS